MHKPKVWHELQSLLQSQTLIEPFFFNQSPGQVCLHGQTGDRLSAWITL